MHESTQKKVFYKKVLWYMISLFLVILWALDGFWIFSSYLMERVQWFLLAYLTHSLNLFEFTISICKYVLEVKSHKRDNSSSVVDSLILFLKVLSIFQEITVCRYVSPTLYNTGKFIQFTYANCLSSNKQEMKAVFGALFYYLFTLLPEAWYKWHFFYWHILELIKYF